MAGVVEKSPPGAGPLKTGGRSPAPRPAGRDPIRSFLQKVSSDGQVVFKSWNGELKGVDSDAILHFGKDSKVELEDRGFSVERYEGFYRFGPGEKVEISLVGYQKAWPAMVLRQEGDTFLLFREDGETSWAAGHPDPEAVASMNGFWPFRASN